MCRNDGVRFTSSSVKIPQSSVHVPPASVFNSPSWTQNLSSHFSRTTQSLTQLIHSFRTRPGACHQLGSKLRLLSSLSLSLPRPRPRKSNQSDSIPHKPGLLCCASLSLIPQPDGSAPSVSEKESSLGRPGDSSESEARKGQSVSRQKEERVLISEVLVRNKDGEELERKDLEMEALQALRACRANSALTVQEVQEDVLRIIESGYFCSCLPVAVDTRDGISLVFQNQTRSSRGWCVKGQTFFLRSFWRMLSRMDMLCRKSGQYQETG